VTPIELSIVIFGCVFGSALVGMWLATVIPERHLSAETRDLVKLGVGLIGTMAALVLGLLVTSTKSSYDTRCNELTQIAANTILLDRTLAHYGVESSQIRGMLKITVARTIDQIWPKDGTGPGGFDASTDREVILDKIQELTPRTDTQRVLQAQAVSVAFNLGQMRWLLFEQNGSAITTPFLVVVVFWLSILFASLGLFAPRNTTAFITLLVSAMAVAGAMFLVLELDGPFTGMIKLSDAPLRNVLAVLGR
jgi:hypothetical protein